MFSRSENWDVVKFGLLKTLMVVEIVMQKPTQLLNYTNARNDTLLSGGLGGNRIYLPRPEY